MIIPFSLEKTLNYFKEFFRKGHERSINAKRNIITSLIIRLLGIIISFLLVPLTINYVNSEQYGIWLTLSSIVGWLGYFDIGFGNGLRNRFAESIAKGEYIVARKYVSTTYAALLIIVLIVISLLLLINPLLNWAKMLNAPQKMFRELSNLAFITILFFSIQLFLQLVSTVIIANQQPAKASLLNLISSLISLLTIFVLTKTTEGSLLYLGLALSLPPVLILLIASFWYYINDYQDYAPSIRYIEFSYIKDLMSLGIKFFILQIGTLILYQASNVIIAHIFGNESVTIYNIAYKYFNIIPMFMIIIMMPLWSAYTDAWARNEIKWIKNTTTKLTYIWFGLSIMVFFMLIFSKLAYRLWVGNEIEVIFTISLSLSFYVIINIGTLIYSIFLNGLGIIKIQLLLSIFGILINIPLAILLGKTFGLPGVILANTIISAINLLIYVIQYKKIINLKATGIWLK